MMSTLKAEFRKLFTVRSTYIIFALSVLFVIFFAGYIDGYKADAASLLSSAKLANDVTTAVGSISILGALIALLLFAHEYRYSTIMYTLTSVNHRTKVLIAKIIAVSVVALLLTAAIGVLSPIISIIGIHIKGTSLSPQTFYYKDLIWHCLFYGWGYAMAGLLLVAIIRNQIGAIVALFLIPSTVETLLGLLLKKNVVYLPFTALGQVLQEGNSGDGSLKPAKAALVFALYLIVGWIIAWVLFLRRDAN